MRKCVQPCWKPYLVWQFEVGSMARAPCVMGTKPLWVSLCSPQPVLGTVERAPLIAGRCAPQPLSRWVGDGLVPVPPVPACYLWVLS